MYVMLCNVRYVMLVMYVCMHACMYAWMQCNVMLCYVCMCMYVYINIYNIYAWFCIHLIIVMINVYIYGYTHAHIYIHIYIHTLQTYTEHIIIWYYMYLCVHIYILYIHCICSWFGTHPKLRMMQVYPQGTRIPADPEDSTGSWQTSNWSRRCFTWQGPNPTWYISIEIHWYPLISDIH